MSCTYLHMKSFILLCLVLMVERVRVAQFLLDVTLCSFAKHLSLLLILCH